MKAIITRRANKGMMGGVTFTLFVKVLLDEDERELIDKYKLGNTVLYFEDFRTGTSGFFKEMFENIKTIVSKITVNNLVNGTNLECKTLGEMLNIEPMLRTSCANFQGMLERASTFGKEEVFDFRAGET